MSPKKKKCRKGCRAGSTPRGAGRNPPQGMQVSRSAGVSPASFLISIWGRPPARRQRHKTGRALSNFAGIHF